MDIFLKKQEKKIKKDNGFTLVEFIVAMSVFVILLTIATGIFVKSIQAQRDVVNRLAVISNAGLALEQMSREIRTGHNFSLVGSVLEFKNKDGNNVTYKNVDSMVERTVLTVSGSNVFYLTSPKVKVEDLLFTLKQSATNDKPEKCNPQKITISLKVGSDNLDDRDNMILQTTISSRVLPIESSEATQELIEDCSND